MARLVAERTLPTLMSPETSTYHGKVMRLDEAKALVKVDHDISLTNLERVIPYKHAKDLILNSPDSIALVPCPCRESKEDHCEPVDVCLWIGEPFVSFVLEHKTEGARRISQDEALDILKARMTAGISTPHGSRTPWAAGTTACATAASAAARPCGGTAYSACRTGVLRLCGPDQRGLQRLRRMRGFLPVRGYCPEWGSPHHSREVHGLRRLRIEVLAQRHQSRE